MTHPDPYGQNPYATGRTGEAPQHGYSQYGYPQPHQQYPDQQYPDQQFAPQYAAVQYDKPAQYDQTQQYAPQQVPYPPTANGGWAVATIIFFWPLAFVAVSRAFSVYPLWAQGRYSEAQAASESVRKLGITALAVFAALIVVYIIFVIILVAVDASSVDTTSF